MAAMRHLHTVGLCLGLVAFPTVAQGKEFRIVKVSEGLYRGVHPVKRTDFEQLKEAGIRTLLDVRLYRPLAFVKEERLAAEYGLKYILYLMPPWPWTVKYIERGYQHLLKTEDYPIFLHCNLDRDRTVVLYGLYRVRELGWPVDLAHQQMREERLQGWLWFYHVYFDRYALCPPDWAKSAPEHVMIPASWDEAPCHDTGPPPPEIDKSSAAVPGC
jgi:hypothetical protein